MKMSPILGNLSEGGITYLLGELYRQTGNMRQAVEFFQKVVNDKELDTEPKYIKLARFQWESLKDSPSAETDQEDEKVNDS